MTASPFNLSTLELSKDAAKDTIFVNGRNPIPLREYAPISKVNGFIQNEMGISLQGNPRYDWMITYRTELEMIQKYAGLYNQKVFAFNTAQSLGKLKWGRTIPANNCSLNIMHRPTRHAFCKEKYEDWDMVNAHVSFICEMFKARDGVDISALVEYNSNPKKYREALAIHHGLNPVKDKDAAKQLFIRILFGGSYRQWIKDFDIDKNISPSESYPLVVSIENQLGKIRELFYDANPQLVKDLKKHNPEKFDSHISDISQLKRTLLAIALQTIERWIMESCVDFLVKQKGFDLRDIVPCQDGFMILKSLTYAGLGADIERVTFEKFGMCIGWVRKEFDEAIEIPDGHDESPEFRHADDDESAARMIIADLKDELKYSFNRIFIKKDNLWVCDPAKINDHIFVFVLKSNIKKQNAKGEWASYAQNNRTAKAIAENVIKILRDESVSNDDFYHKLHTTTKGRVCFKDGVLDFAGKRFYKWTEIDFEYYSPVMINYNFEAHFNNPDRALSAKIMEDVFRPLFGDKTSLALQFLSRAICGHSDDKNWASLLGKRNNGKGVIFDGLSNAFGEYVRAFELENLLYQRKREDITESSRKSSWLLDLEWTRLAIAQEIPDPKSGLLLNGKKTKKMQSGGDVHTARRNYDIRDTEFILELTLLIMGNNSIVPDDEDVMEKCIEFSTSLQFKTQIEIDMMREEYADMPLMMEGIRVENPHLKTQIKTDEWRNAIIMLLYDYYAHTRISIERRRENVEMNTLRGRILELYEVTGNKEDLIPVKDVAERLDETLRKISNEMEGIGIKKKIPTSGVYRKIACFVGLKKIVTENAVENMEGESESK